MTEQHLDVEEAAALRRSPRHLADLLDPIPVDEFLRDYWQQQPLVVHRGQPDRYSDLLTLADVDHILANSSLDDRHLRLVADGTETPISELLPESLEGRTNGLEALYERYRTGATVNLMFLHERWPALAALTQTLSTELSASTHGNVYLTPPGSRGLTPHHDTHDVFVLQLYGTKNWTLHPGQTVLPLIDQHFKMPEDGAGEPIQDFVMLPGDLAYLPRGTVHAAKANEAASLHLTIGASPMLWAHVVRLAVERVLSEDVTFREPLPVGFVRREELQNAAATRLRALLEQLAGQAPTTEVIDDAARKMLFRRPPSLTSHLLDLEALPAVGLSTPIRRRPDVEWQLTRDDEHLHLEFHGKDVELPEYVSEELSFIVKADEFTGAEVPGSLDDDGRLVLIRQLLQEGFLTSV